jgi:hypothetical protein
MRLCSLVLLLAMVSVAFSGVARARDIAFETIPLKHVTAGEIAPLLGPRFQYAGELSERPKAGGQAAADAFLNGVELIAAAHQSSRYLLAAGTAEGVATLRAFLAQFDVQRGSVRLVVRVYPAPPAGAASGWVSLDAAGTVSPSVRVVRAGQQLSFPALPAHVKPREIAVTTCAEATELIPLPTYANWPQVLLAASTAMGAGVGRTVTVGVGVLETGTSPRAAVRQAWGSRYTGVVQRGERLAIMLSRGDSALTAVVSVEGGG